MEKSQKRLRAEERNFMIKVNEAIFVNPFSSKRSEIDRFILGKMYGENLSTREKEQLLAEQVAYRLEEIVGKVRWSIQEYNSEDRKLLEYGVLFSVYHRFCDDLDNHIAQQLAAGESPCKVSFARDGLGQITEQGVS